MCTHMYTCSVHTHVNVYEYAHTQACMCVYIHKCSYVHTCTYTCTWYTRREHLSTCRHVCVHTHKHMLGQVTYEVFVSVRRAGASAASTASASPELSCHGCHTAALCVVPKRHSPVHVCENKHCASSSSVEKLSTCLSRRGISAVEMCMTGNLRSRSPFGLLF